MCRPDCPFVHNVNSLQLPLELIQRKLVAALSKGPGTRLSAAALRAAEGGSSGGQEGSGAAAAAAAGGSGRHEGEWDFAQSGAQASPSKSSRGDAGSVTSSGPASAAAATSARRTGNPASDGGSGTPAAAARSAKQQAAARHEARLAGLLGTRTRPRELRLCK